MFEKKYPNSEQNALYGMNLDMFFLSLEDPKWNFSLKELKAQIQEVKDQYDLYKISRDLKDYAAMLHAYSDQTILMNIMTVYTRNLRALDESNMKAKEAFISVSILDGDLDSAIESFKDLIEFTDAEFDAFLLILDPYKIHAKQFLKNIRSLVVNIDPTSGEFYSGQIEKYAKLHKMLPYDLRWASEHSNHSDRSVRRASFYNYAFVKEQLDDFSELLNGSIQQQITLAKKYGFKSAFEMSAHGSGLTGEEVWNIMDTIQLQNTIYREYYSFKSAKLGLNDFALYDINAPLDTNNPISIQEAIEYTISLGKFISDDIGTSVKQFFEEGRVQFEDLPHRQNVIHAENCYNGPWAIIGWKNVFKTSYLSYVFHEIGHCVDNLYGQRAAGKLMNMNSLVPSRALNESHSTFFEAIGFYFILEADIPLDIKKTYLSSELESLLFFIFRERQPLTLECNIEQSLLKGDMPSGKQISDWHMTESQEIAGTEILVPEEAAYRWTSRRHSFETPYYNYQYTLASLNALLFINLWKEDKEKFMSNYTNLLNAGWDGTYKELMQKHMNIDVAETKNVAKALAQLQEMKNIVCNL
ncbi:MAG: M3 family metallopeptidase [Candidatus Gracilibacteria bacterium]